MASTASVVVSEEDRQEWRDHFHEVRKEPKIYFLSKNQHGQNPFISEQTIVGIRTKCSTLPFKSLIKQQVLYGFNKFMAQKNKIFRTICSVLNGYFTTLTLKVIEKIYFYGPIQFVIFTGFANLIKQNLDIDLFRVVSYLLNCMLPICKNLTISAL